MAKKPTKAAKASSKKKAAKKPVAKKPLAKAAKKAVKKAATKKAAVKKPAKAVKKAAAKPKKRAGGGRSAESSLTKPVSPVIKDDPKGAGRKPVKAAKPSAEPPAKRKLGLRGAAPWAARHAAKHAAEARARAAEPAPPGSARATIRVPTGAEEIKAKIEELYNKTQHIRTLRKRLEKGFFEIGQVLAEIQERDLHVAKGYGSFEAFLEREIDLGKQTALKLIKIAHIFQQEAALDYGMDRLFAALAALEGETAIPKPSIPSSPGSRPMLPLKPPVRPVVG